MTNRTLLAIFLALAGLTLGVESACVAQERITGRAKLIDGDSFEIGAKGIRLFGIDAPEGRQSCTRGGTTWACGDAAAAELRRLADGRSLSCREKDRDDYGRIVAVCRVGDTDLGAAMVRAGLALAYRRYSTDYVAEENAARSARRGLWAGEFTPPWEWRQDDRAGAHDDVAGRTTGDRPVSSTAARPGCLIKGNINGKGERIYHTPSSVSYASTKIDESRGERWFCSEQEARAAGWRAPRG